MTRQRLEIVTGANYSRDSGADMRAINLTLSKQRDQLSTIHHLQREDGASLIYIES